MRFSSTLLFSLVSFAAASRVPRTISTDHGTILAPVSGTVVSAGVPFPFTYQNANWCEDGYTPISAWLLSSAPVAENMNSTGQFPDAVYYFGGFLIANFGLPPIGNPVPPATLTVPDVSQLTSGSKVYLAVVETGTNCPPGNTPAQYGMTSTLLITA